MKYTVKLWFTGTYTGVVSAKDPHDAVQQLEKVLRDTCPLVREIEDYDLIAEEDEEIEEDEDKDETT